jgi:hypothetical protein
MTKTLMIAMFASLATFATATAYATPAKPAVDTKHSVSGQDGQIHVATCVDGKEFYSRTNEHRGACSGHGGVAAWADGSEVKSHGRKTSYR